MRILTRIGMATAKLTIGVAGNLPRGQVVTAREVRTGTWMTCTVRPTSAYERRATDQARQALKVVR